MKMLLKLALITSTAFVIAIPAFPEDRETEVTQAERSLRDAMNAKDSAALDRLLSNDIVWFSLFGPEVRDKAMLMKSASEGQMTGGEAPANIRVRIYGDTAVVTAASATTANQNRPTYFTRVWVRNGGHWELVSWHASRAAERQHP